MDLRHVNFSHSKLVGTNLTKSDLYGANFDKADMRSANLDVSVNQVGVNISPFQIKSRPGTGSYLLFNHNEQIWLIEPKLIIVKLTNDNYSRKRKLQE